MRNWEKVRFVMIKALLLCIGLTILLFGANYLKVFEFLASGAFFWMAVALFILMIVTAIFVLGIPVGGENKDERDGD